MTSDIVGLTSQEVKARIAKGQVNVDDSPNSNPYAEIFKSNICTLFNLVNVVLAVFVFLTGEYKNMLFMCIIIINVLIGIVQEIRSKITTDRLAIVVANKVCVMRDGITEEIHPEKLVLDDIIKIGRGDQVPADCEVIESTCQVNESLLTGESNLITKKIGDKLMSGSFVNSGQVWARVIHVGADNYAAKITNAAKAKQALNSEIMKSLNAIIKYVSIILIPVGILLFSKSYFIDSIDYNESVLSTVSALIGMIPEGLILLTSTVLAVSVVRLARKKVLVQKLYCIETLARVETLCLDKTGTITSGRMNVTKVVAIKEEDKGEINQALKSLVYSDGDKNETALAIEKYYKERFEINVLTPTLIAPFSSDNKWSGATFANKNSYCMGAAQFVLANNKEAYDRIKDQLDTLTQESRVLLVAKVDGFEEVDNLPKFQGKPEPIGFVCIDDDIRDNAAQTISFFAEQGVDIKVISGDDPRTVSGIAKKVGIVNADKYVDATTLVTPEQIDDAVFKYSVFGRVKPEQKEMFVKALKKGHKTVAMTGDGVNDVMALKAADCSVVMAEGSDAARNIAHLILVDNDFAHMPEVVAEGRRSINNLQRSGSLFLVKTIMSLVLSIVFVILPWQYPFTPIQMTVFSCLCVGIPSFVLALEPNHELVRGHFLANCIVKSIPGATCAILGIVAISIIGNCFLGLDTMELETCSLVALCFLGVLLIVRISYPYTPLRIVLIAGVIISLIIAISFMKPIFDIAQIDTYMTIMLVAICAINFVIYNKLYNFLDKWHKNAIKNEALGKEDRVTKLFKKFF